MELLKQNLHQALDYSFYQSKYEIAGLGGYTELAGTPTYNNLPYWRIYTNSYNPPYLKNLTDRTLELYNIYNNSINTEISKFGATKVTIKRESPASNYALVTAFSDKPIKLEKPNLTIEENGTIKEIIQTNIFDQFDLGKDNFVDKDNILQTVLDGISETDLATSGSLTYHCTPDRNPTSEEVFEATNDMTIVEAENLIKNSIKTTISDLEDNLNSVYGLKFDISLISADYDIESEIETSCDTSTGDSDLCEMCCCDELGEDFPCGTWYKTECDFDYYGAVRVLVGITDKTKSYAVYDDKIGTTDLRKIQLKFYVVSGNKELINLN